MSGERILITGASGFVGSAVARAFERRGYDLTLLVRPSSPRTNVAGLNGDLVEGDLNDAASLRRALKDIRYLVHVAADYRLWARDPNEIVRNNLEGARATMQAALEAGVEKIVYTSSVATLKPVAGKSADETSRHDETTVIGAYKLSKVVAERLVEKMVMENALPATIVSPSTPIGPRDIRPTPTGRIIVEAATGKMPAFVDTGLNLVHVDDVAQGHLLALDHGEIGERYILGGEDVSLRQMLGVIAELAHRRPPRVKLPRGPLYPLAYAAETVARFTNKEPFLTADALNMSKYRMFFSSDKASRAFGYKARPYREGLADAMEWFGQEGYLQ
jgi:dihydroflavonol-4-reductase